MLKCDVNVNGEKNKRVRVDAEGSLAEIADDISNIANSIYLRVQQEDAESADIFRKLLQALFADDGPVWTEQEGTADA